MATAFFRHRKRSWLILAVWLVGVSVFRPVMAGVSPAAAWGAKPVLAHIMLDPTNASQLQADLDLSPAQLQAVLQVARQEFDQIRLLELESAAILGNPDLTHAQKTGWVAQSKTNQRIVAIIADNQQVLLNELGMDRYQAMVDWIEARWAQESAQFSQPTGLRKILARLAQKTYPRSFEVYATRYEAGDRKIVALPDKCLKFANGGALQCPGYAYGQGYSVAISYEGNLVVALVAESGPWNIDDNYWSKTSDPQPRRMFADLPLGVPEAQAAYFNSYNGGLDQFGRLVTSPVAIDISKALAADLGLGPGNNPVTVSFLWTEGWDNSQGQAGSNPSGATQAAVQAQPPLIGWQTVAPDPDGSIVHIVQSGQTLAGIAAVYGIPLADLLAQNSLTMQSIIQPGDRIVVKEADPTRTPTQTATLTATPARQPGATSTPKPTLTATPQSPATPTPTDAVPPNSRNTPADWILASMISLAIAGVVLVAWGLLIRRKRR